MLKKRVGIWAIFLVACLVSQLIVSVIPTAVVSIKQWQLEQKLEAVKKENEAAATEPSVESTTPSEPVDDETDQNKADVKAALSTIVEIICTAARYLGIVVTIFGVFNLILAFAHEDPEAIGRGMSMAVVGGALVGLSAIFPMLMNGMSG